MVTDPAKFVGVARAVMRQDAYERFLYGATVVDAYVDLEKQYAVVARRLRHLPAPRLRRLAYTLLGMATRGGLRA